MIFARLSRLRQRRLELALTQQQLAVLAGMSKQALGKLERGQSGVRPSTLAKLSEALKCSPRELLD